jgi:hypothetical protein
VGPPEENTAESGGEQSPAGNQQAGSSAEPTFSEQSVGSSGLPDLRDEPSLEDTPAGTGNTPGEAGQTASSSGDASGGGQTGGQTAGQPSGGQKSGSGAGGSYGSGNYGSPAGMPTGSGSGPLTPAEQVAILDAQLEKGAGEFDALILETEAEQREAAREAAKQSSSGGGISAGTSTAEEGNSPYDEGMASTSGYSTGGGMGGAGGGAPPQDTAKYPAPADIPSGSDDDVVARQLREAASREADPAVREKLWAEYRKYKGIE